jgi:GT2 family glycosyltransferase
MRFSVVIPTCNRRDALGHCLAAVMAQDYADFEVIVVDDGSSDGTERMVHRQFPRVRYIRQETTRGPAAARNRGVREAGGDLIAFTDDDCAPPADWLQAHLRSHQDETGIGAVGGVQVPPSPNFFDKVQMAHDAGDHRGAKRIAKISDWKGLATNNLSVPRYLFDKVGYFDEHFITGSDPEFTRRVCRAGYVLILDPHLQVKHLKVHTLRSYLKTCFHRACGSILTDIKENTLALRRFVPLPNMVRLWREWCHFREMFDGEPGSFARFWTLAIVARWVEVAGRLYYYHRAAQLRSPAKHRSGRTNT